LGKASPFLAGRSAKAPPDLSSAASESFLYAEFKSIAFPESVTYWFGLGSKFNGLLLSFLPPGDALLPGPSIRELGDMVRRCPKILAVELCRTPSRAFDGAEDPKI